MELLVLLNYNYKKIQNQYIIINHLIKYILSYNNHKMHIFIFKLNYLVILLNLIYNN